MYGLPGGEIGHPDASGGFEAGVAGFADYTHTVFTKLFFDLGVPEPLKPFQQGKRIGVTPFKASGF